MKKTFCDICTGETDSTERMSVSRVGAIITISVVGKDICHSCLLDILTQNFPDFKQKIDETIQIAKDKALLASQEAPSPEEQP
jgi:hypothetical protein